MRGIKIRDLPSGVPDASKLLPMDLTATEKATIKDVVYAGRPAASQAEAEAGTDAEKVMTPLTTKQSIASEVGDTIASAAQGSKADTAVQPEDISDVATTGQYNDLLGKPEVGVTLEQLGADGTPTGDTQALLAAIASGSPKITFGPRTYLINGTAPIMGASGQEWVGYPGLSVLKLVSSLQSDWVYFNSKTNFSISGLTFDGNGFLTTSTVGAARDTGNGPDGNPVGVGGSYPQFLPAVLLVECSDYVVTGNEFINFYTCGLLANICSQGEITLNKVTRSSAMSTPANYGIAVVGSVAPANSHDVRIAENTLAGCQISTNGNKLFICDNNISGWGFSAGVNTGASNASFDLIISGNRIYGSSPLPDRDGYYPDGIENWARDTTITGNVCFSNAGHGIRSGSKLCSIQGNTCYDNGTGITDAVGIYAHYQDSTFNASGSSVVSNKCYDTRSSGKTQKYGYGEASQLSAIRLKGNDFLGNALGEQLLVSSNQTLVDSSISGSWTPSGVGVSLTVGSSVWRRQDKFSYFQFDITVPTTSDTGNFSIDGVPAGSPIAFSSVNVALSDVDDIRMYVSAGSGRITSNKTNAQMSGKRVIASCIYLS